MTGAKQPCCENDPALPITRSGRQRRQLIIGGAATGSTIMVLWNRSALAAPNCSHSVWHSHVTGGNAFLSHGATVPTSGCGDTPACWINANANDWTMAGGGGANFYHTDQFSSTFNTSGWTLVGTNSLLNALGGGLTIQQAKGKSSQKLPAAFAAQCVASLLNANWYGSAYNSSYSNAAAIKSVVNAILAQSEYEEANSSAQAFVTAAQAANMNSC
jgi:hypothetical protein